MSTTPESKEQILRLFQKHVPEVANGSVEIVSVARAIGRRSCVVVRSLANHVEPVGACTGLRGSRLKAMVGELNGEHLAVVRWDESPQRLIQNALGGEVALDEATHTATVVEPNRNAPDVDLVEELSGWTIRLRRGEEK